MSKQILLINGPNLNLLGSREPSVYGSATLAQVEAGVTAQLQAAGLEAVCFQSNSEGALVDFIQQHSQAAFAIVNAGALTHTSIAFRDALKGTAIPFVEVHISNVHAREDFRHRSYLSDIASGIIVGCGVMGYELAARYLIAKLQG